MQRDQEERRRESRLVQQEGGSVRISRPPPWQQRRWRTTRTAMRSGHAWNAAKNRSIRLLEQGKRAQLQIASTHLPQWPDQYFKPMRKVKQWLPARKRNAGNRGHTVDRDIGVRVPAKAKVRGESHRNTPFRDRRYR